MAEKKIQEQQDGYVTVFVPRAGRNSEEPNLFVSINGVNWLLPKGKESRVPECVAREIQRSAQAQDLLDQRIDQLLAQQK